MAAVSRETWGCKAAFPVPALAAAGNPTPVWCCQPRVGRCLPPSRLPLLRYRDPVEGARGGCLSAVPGQWRPPGHESSSLMSRDTESLTIIPAPGLPAVPAAVMGTGGFPELRQRTGRWLCPATVAAAGGREANGRREAAAPDHPAAEPSGPHPATPNGGREWKPGRGGDRRGHAQEMQQRKFSITAVVPPPPPSGAGPGAGGAAAPSRAAPGRRGAVAAHLLPPERRSE